jgi:hypothetical protein
MVSDEINVPVLLVDDKAVVELVPLALLMSQQLLYQYKIM